MLRDLRILKDRIAMKNVHPPQSGEMNVCLLRRERAQALELAVHFLRTAAIHQGQVFYYLRTPFALTGLRKYLWLSAIEFVRQGRLEVVGLWKQLFAYSRIDSKPVNLSSGDTNHETHNPWRSLGLNGHPHRQ